MTRIYGASDDLVEIESEEGLCEELDCPDGAAIRIWLFDGTILRISYGKDGKGIWKIVVEQTGRFPCLLIECDDEDADVYSDVLRSESPVKRYKHIKRDALC